MVLRRWDPFFNLFTFAEHKLLPIDAYETSKEVVVMAHVPGVTPDAVKITLSEGTLTIEVHVPSLAEEEEREDRTWLYHEIAHGDFSRSISVSPSLDASKAEASFDKGVLTLTIPKTAVAKPKQIKVKEVKEIKEVKAPKQP